MYNYSEALDQQIELARFWLSDKGTEILRYLYREYDDNPTFAETNKPIFGVPLMGGECFYWSEPICDLVWSASRSIPSSWAFTVESLPVPCGFFWLGKPIVHEASHSSIRAISWVPLMFPREKDKEKDVIIVGQPPDSRDKWKGVSLLGRPSTNLAELRASEDRIGITFFFEQQGLPVPAPLTVLVWPVGGTLERPGQRLDGDILHNPEKAEAQMKLLGSMLMFLKQKILVPYRQRPDRSTRHRAEKANRQDAIINIVKLRQMVHHPKESSTPVEWTCQWLVRGHWRNQWYPRQQFHQPRWIVPYIKGPKDKPLREPKRFFAVVR